VGSAGSLDALTAGVGAAQAVHADLKEELSSVDVGLQNFADQGILGNDHNAVTSVLNYFGTPIIPDIHTYFKGYCKNYSIMV